MSPELASPDPGAAFRVDRLPKRTLRQHIAERLRSAILAGDLAPGTPLVEATLATQFNVSRGPLREALRQLVEEGLLVTVPYTGTRVTSVSVEDVREIYSMRIVLERFAFEQAWDKRDAAFRREMRRRKNVLTTSIDAGDDTGSILAELNLHGLVYEASGHRLLQPTTAIPSTDTAMLLPATPAAMIPPNLQRRCQPLECIGGRPTHRHAERERTRGRIDADRAPLLRP